MWLLVLYGLAGLWALKTLLALMINHKQSYLLQLKQQRDREQVEQGVLNAIEKKQQELPPAPTAAVSRAA